MNFSIEKKGYNVDEVNAYIDDLETKYMTLQSQNSELEQKLATAKRLIRRFSDTENALKQSIADSKRAAAYMISDAQERKDALLDSARESCGEIISELDMEIAKRMQTINLMKAEVSAFKDAMFELYSTHIELIDELGQKAESFEYRPDYTKVADAVDEFEEKQDVECEIPEFVEYPEESIFAEIVEKESCDEGFVLDADVSEIVGAEAEEAAFESEDYSQIVLDAKNAPTAGFNIINGDVTEDDLMEEQSFAEFIGNDSDIIGAAEAVSEEETDYFKFLEEFANSEDIEG